MSLYLAAAGVGTLGIIDYDVVDLTSIQRQVLYSTSDVGRPKLDAAKERLRQLNPEIDVIAHSTHLSSWSAIALFSSGGKTPSLGESRKQTARIPDPRTIGATLISRWW